jgi:flagellar motor switch protein FliM
MALDLGQEEIDAMFAAARASAVAESAPAEKAARKEPYNFGRAGQISNDQMKAISTVNDLFARNLTHNLGAWLRTRFQVNLVSGEQMVYAEYLDLLPEISYVCSARLEPLDSLCVMQLDLTLAAPMVDLLLGGVGHPMPVREPTDIEEEILMSVMEIVTRELNAAWQPVGLEFALEKREMEAQVARLMPVSEKMLCVSFEIRMPEAQGTFTLCLPAVVLNTILRKLITDRDRPRRRSMESRARLSELMVEAKFGAILQLPTVRLSARSLQDLAPGQILRLPLPRHATGELRVGGLPLFSAQPVRTGEHRGAQVRGYGADAQRQSTQ